MLICGDGTYPRVQPAAVEQTSRQQITSSPSAASFVYQTSSMVWSMLMQIQQPMSGYSASSQRSNYFVCKPLVNPATNTKPCDRFHESGWEIEMGSAVMTLSNKTWAWSPLWKLEPIWRNVLSTTQLGKKYASCWNACIGQCWLIALKCWHNNIKEVLEDLSMIKFSNLSRGMA